MNTLSVDSEMLRHCVEAETAVGRWCLNNHVRLQRCFWRCLVAGGEALKRAFDIVASAIFLAVMSPLYLLLTILVKLEDGGPVFFNQTRVGQFGREFKMYKYRSMRVDAEALLPQLLAQNQHKDGVTFKIKNDPRLTRVGKWLRKFSFDELPQVYNVLIGDMSLVGPRPPVPREVARYSLIDRHRLAVKPGITCFWQIGGRSEIDFSGQVKLDVKYIESQSFHVDIEILVKTLPAVLSGTGAY